MASPTKEENLLESDKSSESGYDPQASPTYEGSTPSAESQVYYVDPASQKSVEELQVELEKVEGEIAMLRQVLGSKVRYATELKRQMGITPFQEFKSDLQSGLQHIKESETYIKTNEKLHQINDKITHSTAYQKTSSAVKTASEKTSAAVSTLGGAVSKKLGDIRNSQTFKSLEEKVEHTYANVKAKVAGSKSNSSIDEVLKESEAGAGAGEPEETVGDLPAEKVPL